jgi:hypothetical protein
LLGALDAALTPRTSYCLELWERAEWEAKERRRATQALIEPLPKSLELLAAPPPTAAAAPVPELRPSATSVERASEWLEKTDDAARELTGWLIKHEQLPADLPGLLMALRAPQLDGLARPARRMFRVAAGARLLGFERDMSQRMRGDGSVSLLVPSGVCVALSVPDDIRVLQPGFDYGLLSDLAAAQALGEGLALALTSPALGSVHKRPLDVSVSTAFGGLFLQLRADSEYLRHVDELSRDVAARAGRHAALWLLLRSRLAAAQLCAQRGPAGSSEQRIQQLMAAGERALGWELPRGIAALTLLDTTTPEQAFGAFTWGCELHAALRDRFDEDYYRNPRVSEVLRGAAARGNALALEDLAAELASRPSAALTRVFELLG